MTDFTLSQVIEGFLLSKSAQGLSVHTIANYPHLLDQFASFVGPDIAFSSITTDHITRFLAWLQTECRTSRGQPLSAKTVSGTMPLCPLSGRGPRTKVFYHTLRRLVKLRSQVQAPTGDIRWGLQHQ